MNDNISAFKARLLSEKSMEKQANIGGSSFLKERLKQELAPLTPPKEFIPYHHKPGVGEHFGRGLYEGIAGTANLGWGLTAGAAAVAESAVGAGGITTKVKEGAAKKFLDNQEKMSKDASPTDSFLYSYNKAKEGEFGALIDWAAHGTGYVTSQLASILTGSGVIGVASKPISKKVATQLMGGLVRKEATRIATKKLGTRAVKATAAEIAELAASDAILKSATSSIATKVGSQIGMGSMSLGLEGGEIMGDLAQQSIDKERTLTGGEIGKGLTATALAGAVEYLELVMNIKALKGKLGGLPGGKTVDGLTGKALRTGTTGGKVAVGEAIQEYTQTGIEQWGKGEDLFSQESKDERIDAAALGALGGGPASVGGVFTKSQKEQEVADQRRADKLANKRLVTPETQPDYKEKKAEVDEALKSGDVSEYTDPKKKETYAPLIVINAMHDKTKDPEITLEEKIKTVDDARAIFKEMSEEKQKIADELEAIVAPIDAEGRKPTLEEAKTIKALDAKSATVTALMEKTHPLLVSMLKNKEAPVETHEEALKQFREVFTKGSSSDVQSAIRKVYGSNGGKEFLQGDGEGSLNLEQLLTENKSKLDKATIQQIEQIISLKEAVAKVTARDVHSGIMVGQDGYKGIPEHLQGIASAIESGDMKQAAARQKSLQRWANERERRAKTFMTLSIAFNKNENIDPKAGKITPEVEKALSHLTDINIKQHNNGLNELTIGPETLGLAKLMRLEANALNQAVKTGESLLPGKTQEVAPDATPVATEKVVSETSIVEPKPTEQTTSVATETSIVEPKPTEQVPESAEISVEDDEYYANGMPKEKRRVDHIIKTYHNEQGLLGQAIDRINREKDKPVPDKKQLKVDEEAKTIAQEAIAYLEEGNPWLAEEVKNRKSRSNKSTPSLSGNTTNVQSVREKVVAQLKDKDIVSVNQEIKKMEYRLNKEEKGTPKHDAIMGDLAAAKKILQDKQEASIKSKETTPEQTTVKTFPRINKTRKQQLKSYKDPERLRNLIKQNKNRLKPHYKDPKILEEIEYAEQLLQEIEEVKESPVVAEPTNKSEIEVEENPKPTSAGGYVYKQYNPEISAETEEKLVSLGFDEVDIKGVANEKEAQEHIEYETILEESDVEAVNPETQTADLKSIGFRDTEIGKILSESKIVKEILKYKDSSLNKLRKAYETAEDNSALQELITKIATAKKRIMNVRLTDSTIDPATVERTNEQYKKINQVQVFGFPKKGPQNLFNSTENVIAHLKELTEKYNWKNDKDPAKQEHDALVSLINYMSTFSKAVDELYEDKKIGFQYQNTLSYFAVDGKIDENVKLAMALTGFNWLTLEAGQAIDERAVRGILGLPKTTPITSEALELLEGKGNKAVYLANIIGRRVFKDLQIGLNGKALENAEENISNALGMMTLATLQHERMVDRHYINSGISKNILPKDATDGLHGLANKLKGVAKGKAPIVIKDFVRASPTDANEIELNRKGGRTVTDHFFSRANNRRVDSLLKKTKVLTHLINDIFSLDQKNQEITFIKPELTGGRRKIEKSDELATLKQTKNLEQNEQVPIVRSETMQVLELLPIEIQKNLAGWKTTEGEHISNHVRIRSVNNGIDRAFDAIESWKRMANKAGDLTSEFFIRSVFQTNNRMRQIGLIQLQNSKIVRSLFAMKETVVKVDKNNEEHVRSFMEAIALGIGKEASKENSLNIAIQKAQDILDSEVVQNGLKAIDQLLEGKQDLSSEQHQAIEAAVKEGGEDLLSFKCLVEYQKFQRADGEFTTDVYIERDGLANGPFMMLLQLSRSVTTELLSRLQSTGLNYLSPNERSEGDHKVQNDPYEQIGAVWGKVINGMLDALVTDSWSIKVRYENAAQEIERIHAINNLLGSTTDQTALTEHSRKMAKNMTVGAIYGAGKKSTVQALTTHIIDTVIPDTLKEIANLRNEGKKDSVKLQQAKTIEQYLSVNVRTLSGLSTEAIWESHKAGRGPLYTVLTRNARKGIEASINSKYGDALFEAMEEVYGDFRESSEELNKGIGILAARYNAALRILVNQIEGPITREIVAEIKKKLRPLLPKVKTPMGGFLPLFDFTGAELLPNDEFAGVEQYYSSKEISVLRSKAQVVKELLASGVKPIPTIIHMFDSMVANNLMGVMDPESKALLNVHDSGITGIFDGKFMSDNQNRIMHHLMLNNHVADMVQKTVTKTLATFETMAKEGVFDLNGMKIKPDYLDYMINEQYSKEGYNVFGRKTLSVKETDKAVIQEITYIAESTKATKEAVLDGTTAVNQYYNPDGGHETERTAQKDIAGVLISDVLDATDLSIPVENQHEVYSKETVEEITVEDAIELVKVPKPVKNTPRNPNFDMTRTDQGSNQKIEIQINNDGVFTTVDGMALSIKEFPGIKFAWIKKPGTTTVWAAVDVNTGMVLTSSYAKTKKGVVDKINDNYTLTDMENSLKKYFSSSKNSDLSTDPADYKLEGEINKDNIITTYDSIKNNGGKIDSVEHDIHLKNILTNLVQSVFQPFDLFMATNTAKQTEGAFVHEKGSKDQIFIRNQSGILGQGIQMSTGEVYSHELVHSIIHHGLDQSPQLYAKAARLYEIAYKELSKLYPGEGYRAFLNDPMDTSNVDEVTMAKERFEYLFRNAGTHGADSKNAYTGIVSKKTRSNHIDEFVTFGVTNENFGKLIRDIPLNQAKYTKSTWSDIKGANIQDTLLNIFQKILDFFKTKLTRSSSRTVYQELESLVSDLSQINTEQKTKRFERLRKFSGLAGKVSEKGDSFIKSAVRKIPKVANWKDGIDRAIERPDMLGQSLRDINNKWEAMDHGLMKATAHEFFSMGTEMLKPFHQLLSRRRLLFDSTKEAMALAYRNQSNAFFTKTLTTDQKINFTKAGLKVDASALLDSLTYNKMLEVYKDPKACKAEIDRLFNTLSKNKALRPHLTYYKNAAFALGQHMTTGKSSKDDHVMLNIRAIADLVGRDIQGTLAERDVIVAEALLEQIVSLYAIDSLPMAQRTEFASLMEAEADGVASVLRMHQSLKEEAKNTSFGGDKYLFRKGYTKSIVNPEINLEFGLLEEEKAYARMGYIRSEKPIPRDSLDSNAGIDMYIYTSRTARTNDYQSMILSLSGNKAAGTNTRKMAEQYDQNTAQGLRNLRKLKRDKKAILERMADPNRKRSSALGTTMIAQLDRDGRITDYRYMMSESVKDHYLDQVNQFDVILGAMASQNIDKKLTPKINNELVDLLKTTYDEQYKNNPAAFVEIGPQAINPESLERYYQIPESTKKYIKKVWGPEQTMYVPKEAEILSFGFRKYSITEAFTTKPADRAWIEKIIVGLFNNTLGEGRGVRVVSTLERLAVELTQYAKDNIIVKSLFVSINNFGSNMVYLKMKGVPTSMILKLGWEAIQSGTRYQRDSAKISQLGIELDARLKDNSPKAQQRALEIKKELMVLEDSLARNPVVDSIDSGLMPALVDEVDTQTQQDLFPGLIERNINKGTKRLPKAIKAAGEIAFLTHDTTAYKMLNNAVKMTDFCGRHVLYNYYIKNLKMDKKEAAEKAIAEFINFDIPSHRITEYANQIGLLRFTKYATRIPLIAAKTIIERPFDAIVSYLFSTEFGFDNIYDSVGNLNYKVGTPWSFAWDTTKEIGSLRVVNSILR